jgi:long-subunit fatty acid transport protein
MSKQQSHKHMKRKSLILGKTLAALTTLCVMHVAQADQYHYTNLLIGDRASGLGGAYTAIADDPSGLFYNPAGIVYGAGSNVSGSMNAYQITNITYENVLGGIHDWSRESSGLVPNFFGVFQPFWKGKVGFSYAVVDSILEDQDQTFYNIPNTSVDQFTINTNNQDSTYNIGPSFAMSVTDDFSIGLTLYGHLRTQQLIVNQLVFGTYDPGTGSVPDESWSNVYNELNEYGVRPVLGFMWTPSEKISIGLNINQTYLISSKRVVQSSFKCSANPDPAAQPSVGCASNIDDVYMVEAENNTKAKYPIQTRLGMAYFPSPSLLFSGDLIYNASTDDGKEATLNFAVGSEYYLNADWAIRGGLFSDFANTPKVKSGVAGQAEHIDLLGISMSGTHFSRNSALTVGFSYAAGSGKSDIFNNGNIQNAHMSSLTLYMSATYSY